MLSVLQSISQVRSSNLQKTFPLLGRTLQFFQLSFLVLMRKKLISRGICGGLGFAMVLVVEEEDAAYGLVLVSREPLRRSL